MAQYEEVSSITEEQQTNGSKMPTQNAEVRLGGAGVYLTVTGDRLLGRYEDSGMPDPRSMVAHYVVGVSTSSGGQFVGLREVSVRDSTAPGNK